MIYPMFATVLLTFIIGFAAMRARIASVRMKEINIGYYRLMQAQVKQNIPERVTVTTRSFNNMFEIPVLFYIAGTLSLALDQVTTFSLIIAWGFVLSRIFHTWIHLSYNNILHRMKAYWIGLILVFILWIEQVYLTM